MISKKLPSSLIIGKIKASKNSFAVSTDDIVSLIENKVPEDIISIMIEAANDESKRFVVLDPNNPYDMHDPGIYYYNNSSEGEKLIRIDPTIYSQSKNKGGLATELTYGLAKVKTAVTLDGKASRLQLNESNPVFYIYFDTSNSNPSGTGEWWFSTAGSPNEFLLVKLDQNDKSREVVTGSANLMGASVGVDDKNKAIFQTEKIGKGIFKIYFNEAISGEFCFMYAGSVPTGFSLSNKVYDFGIQKLK